MPSTSGPSPATFDLGNPLLAPGPAKLDATIVTLPGGQALIVTLRTTSATVTTWLARDEAETWRDLLDAKIAKMTSLVLPPPGSPGLNGGRP